MGFKEMVAADISAVFLNPSEFGEIHKLDGNECVCVIYGDSTTARNAALPEGRVTPTGLHGDFVTVCVKASDLGREPKQGTNFTVDGKRYTVDSCTNDMGMLTIVLGAYRMGAPGR
mgnify:CR=1 FL=1